MARIFGRDRCLKGAGMLSKNGHYTVQTHTGYLCPSDEERGEVAKEIQMWQGTLCQTAGLRRWEQRWRGQIWMGHRPGKIVFG
jgi:hypothetical protein